MAQNFYDDRPAHWSQHPQTAKTVSEHAVSRQDITEGRGEESFILVHKSGGRKRDGSLTKGTTKGITNGMAKESEKERLPIQPHVCLQATKKRPYEVQLPIASQKQLRPWLFPDNRGSYEIKAPHTIDSKHAAIPSHTQTGNTPSTFCKQQRAHSTMGLRYESLTIQNKAEVYVLVEKIAEIVCRGLRYFACSLPSVDNALSQGQHEHFSQLSYVIKSFCTSVVFTTIMQAKTSKEGRELAASVAMSTLLILYQVLVANHSQLFPSSLSFANQMNKNILAISIISTGVEMANPIVQGVDVHKEFLKAINNRDFGSPSLGSSNIRGNALRNAINASIRAGNALASDVNNAAGPKNEGQGTGNWTVDAIKRYEAPVSTSLYHAKKGCKFSLCM